MQSISGQPLKSVTLVAAGFNNPPPSSGDALLDPQGNPLLDPQGQEITEP